MILRFFPEAKGEVQDNKQAALYIHHLRHQPSVFSHCVMKQVAGCRGGSARVQLFGKLYTFEPRVGNGKSKAVIVRPHGDLNCTCSKCRTCNLVDAIVTHHNMILTEIRNVDQVRQLHEG